jgi:hypothetical protein
MFELIYPLWSAAWWRLRGGTFGYYVRKTFELPENTNLTQITRGITMLMLVLPLWERLGLWLFGLWATLWVGLLIASWGKRQDMGSVEGTFKSDMEGSVRAGLRLIAPSIALTVGLYLFTSLKVSMIPWLLLMPFLFAMCYSVSFTIGRWTNMLDKDLEPWFKGYTSYAEAAVGLCLGILLTLTFGA